MFNFQFKKKLKFEEKKPKKKIEKITVRKDLHRFYIEEKHKRPLRKGGGGILSQMGGSPSQSKNKNKK